MEDSLLTKEDIILLFLEGPAKLLNEIWDGNMPKSDEIRALICELGNPWCAYSYAKWVDRKPTDETRDVAFKDPWFTYCYTEFIDKLSILYFPKLLPVGYRGIKCSLKKI